MEVRYRVGKRQSKAPQVAVTAFSVVVGALVILLPLLRPVHSGAVVASRVASSSSSEAP